MRRFTLLLTTALALAVLVLADCRRTSGNDLKDLIEQLTKAKGGSKTPEPPVSDADTLLLGVTGGFGGKTMALVGARANGKWVGVDAAHERLPSRAVFRVFNLKGEVGQVESISAEFDSESGWCIVGLPRDVEANNLAVAGGRPSRSVAMRPARDAHGTYRRILEGFLAQNGVRTNRPQIFQVFYQDINGDGLPETIIDAGSRKKIGDNMNVNPNDWSLLLFGYTNKQGKVTYKPLHFLKYGPRAGEFETYRLMAVLDIDNDGRTELVTMTEGYEGTGVALFRFDGSTVTKLFSGGWGV